MKKFLICLISALFLSHCTHFQPSVDPAHSASVDRSRPAHQGKGESGTYGIYSYVVYSTSVSLKDTSGIAEVSIVDVYDLDRDGRLDTVYAKTRGAWRFASNMRSPYPLLKGTLSTDHLNGFLSHADNAREEVRRRKRAESERQQLEAEIRKKLESERTKSYWE